MLASDWLLLIQHFHRLCMKYNTFPIKSTRTRHCIWSLIIPMHIILINVWLSQTWQSMNTCDHYVSPLVEAEGVVVTKCAEIWLQNVRRYKMCWDFVTKCVLFTKCALLLNARRSCCKLLHNEQLLQSARASWFTCHILPWFKGQSWKYSQLGNPIPFVIPIGIS